MLFKCKSFILALSLTFSLKIFGLNYKEIANIALQTEKKIDHNNKNTEKDIWQLFKDDLKTLTRAEQQKLCFEIFDNLNNLEDKKSKNILMPESLHELNILCGEAVNLQNNLRNSLDRTITTFGSISFANILSNPTIDLEILKNRQKFIKALLKNPDLYNKVNNSLQTVKQAENSVFNLWSMQNPLNNKHAQRSLYFQLKVLQKLNKSTKFLEVWRLLHLSDLFNPISSSAQIALGYKFEKRLLKIAGASGLISSLLLYPLTYKAITGIEHLRKLTQKIMIDIANSVKSLSSLAENLKEYNFIYKTNLVNFSEKQEISQELEKLLGLLNSNTFKGKASVFSFLGKSLVAYKYMSEIKSEFIPALQAFGEIDALFSMAKLIKEHENKSVNYCLVNFSNTNTPVLEFKNGWNPLIKPEAAISQNMNFGFNLAKAYSNKKNYIPNLLLTGPHGSGKSCFMRGCMYIALMAQTFGVAPASSCNITIFNKLSTYLNIKEDYYQNLSTFMAERKRVDCIRNIINNLNKGEFSFVIMDEVFKGTMEQEGAKRVYNFGKEISKSNQSICLMATHFNYPTVLEKETGKFINYHVGLEEYDNGRFKRLFKLIPGENKWWFNDSEKRDRFIEWLQTEAN